VRLSCLNGCEAGQHCQLLCVACHMMQQGTLLYSTLRSWFAMCFPCCNQPLYFSIPVAEQPECNLVWSVWGCAGVSAVHFMEGSTVSMKCLCMTFVGMQRDACRASHAYTVRHPLWCAGGGVCLCCSYCGPALASSMYALAVLRFRPPGGWCEALLYETQRQMAAFGAQELSNLIWALAVLKLHPGREWLQDFQMQVGGGSGGWWSVVVPASCPAACIYPAMECSTTADRTDRWLQLWWVVTAVSCQCV